MLVILSVVACGLLLSSVIGWIGYVAQRTAVLALQAKLHAYERQFQQDQARIAQYVDRLDRVRAEMIGYVPTDFDPETKA